MRSVFVALSLVLATVTAALAVGVYTLTVTAL